MAGILWLASFPKSGNTWLRAFLANYMHATDKPVAINDLAKFILGDGLAWPYEKVAGRSVEGMTLDDIHRLRPEVHRMFAWSSPDTVFVKTHNTVAFLDDVPTITPEATAGAVYVMRNPLDLVISHSHHNGVSFDRAIEVLGSDNEVVPPHGNQVHQYIGSWSSHVRNWTTAPGLKPHVVRYEDMTHRPDKTFRRLIKFLDMPLDAARIKRSIRFSSFKTLSGQEKASGFVESVPVDNRVFFRKGKVGDWRNHLTPEQAQRLIDDHREVMAEHGYLKKDGTAAF